MFVGQSDNIHGGETHQTNHHTESQFTIYICRTVITFMEVKLTKGITGPSHDSLSTFVGQSDDGRGGVQLTKGITRPTHDSLCLGQSDDGRGGV